MEGTTSRFFATVEQIERAELNKQKAIEIRKKRERESQSLTPASGKPDTEKTSKFLFKVPKINEEQLLKPEAQVKAPLIWEMFQGGKVELYKSFLDKTECRNLFEYCKYTNTPTDINWEQEYFKIYDKSIPVPRMSAFLGSMDNLMYRYSSTQKVSVRWPDIVLNVKQKIEEALQQKFNVVLLNWYATGVNYIGWHADDTRDLVANSKIASLSVGMTRTFKLRNKKYKMAPSTELNNCHLDIELKSGDLLIMDIPLQKYWHHCVPKLPPSALSSPRINFTFRLVKETAFVSRPP